MPEIRSVVTAMTRLTQAAVLQEREVSGHLVLAAVGGEAAMPYTHAILTRLRTEYPHITFEMRSVNLTGQFEALLQDEVDAAFLRLPLPPGLQTLHLATEPRVVCLAADDPLVGQEPITLAQLAGHLRLDVPPGVPRVWWDFWTENPGPDGRPVRYGAVVADLEAMLLAVARGQGIVFLPAAAGYLYPRPGVAYVQVAELAPSTAVLAWLPANRTRPTVAALRQAAHHVAGAAQQ